MALSQHGYNPGMANGQAGKLKEEWERPVLVGVKAREPLQVVTQGHRCRAPGPLVFPEQPEPRVQWDIQLPNVGSVEKKKNTVWVKYIYS